ncbi:MAG: hypothetical protein AAF970_00860 [Bacteroidota bacterium]
MNRTHSSRRPQALERWRMPSAVLLLTFAVGLVGCDSTGAVAQQEPTSPQAQAVASALGDQLEVSEGVMADLETSLALHEDRADTPGYLWYVAADLQDRLSDQEKEALFASAEAAREQRAERMRAGRSGEGAQGRLRARGQRGQRGQRQGARPGAQADRLERIIDALDLTEEQVEVFRAQRAEHRAEMRALFTAQRSGELSREAFREQARALRMEQRTERQATAEATLTDAQRAQIEALRAERQEQRADRRAAVEAARTDALALTPAQVASLEALREDGRAEREERRAAVRDGGERPDRETVRAAQQEQRQARQEAVAEILTEDQLEATRIYRILAATSMAKARQEGGRRGR